MLHVIINFLLGSNIYTAFDPLTIASLALSLGGGVASLIGSAGANARKQAALNARKAESESFYNKDAYTDALSRSENQTMLRALTDRLKENNKQTQATAAITGATPEAVIAQNNNSNKAYANAVSQMAGLASQHKDIATRQYRAEKRGLDADQNAIDESRQTTWSNLGSNAAQLGGNAIGLMGGSKTANTPNVNAPLFDKNIGGIVEDKPLFG